MFIIDETGNISFGASNTPEITYTTPGTIILKNTAGGAIGLGFNNNVEGVNFVQFPASVATKFRIISGAAYNLTIFDAASEGEIKELAIGGYRTGDALRNLEIGVGVDAADTASFDGVSNYRFDGNLVIVENSEERCKQCPDSDPSDPGAFCPGYEECFERYVRRSLE